MFRLVYLVFFLSGASALLFASDAFGLRVRDERTSRSRD